MFFASGNDSSLLQEKITRLIPDSNDVDIIRTIIPDLCQNSHVVAIYLYGSYARQEQKPYSDIDIAVITNSPYPSRNTREWIGSFSSKKIDVQVYSDLPLPARMQVITQGIPLYIQNQELLNSIIKSVSLSYMDLEPMRRRIKNRMVGFNGYR